MHQTLYKGAMLVLFLLGGVHALLGHSVTGMAYFAEIGLVLWLTAILSDFASLKDDWHRRRNLPVPLRTSQTPAPRPVVVILMQVCKCDLLRCDHQRLPA